MPINFHIGNMGVASAYNDTVDSVPPAMHGGNVDDRRIGKGATMYYPVQVRGRQIRHSTPTCHGRLPVRCTAWDLHWHGWTMHEHKRAHDRLQVHAWQKGGSTPRATLHASRTGALLSSGRTRWLARYQRLTLSARR